MLDVEGKDLSKVLSDEVRTFFLLALTIFVPLICLQQPAILEPEAEEPEADNHVASLFDNDIQMEAVQELGDESDNRDVVMISKEISHSQHSSMSNPGHHQSVPPTTDSDVDIAMRDEDSEPEDNHPSNHRQQSSKKSDSSTQSQAVRGTSTLTFSESFSTFSS